MPELYYRTFVKDNSAAIVGHILVYLKGIIIMPIIIKSVGATVYGGFVLLTSILGIVFGVSSFGAGFRAKRFMPSAKSMSERGKVFYPQFMFNVLTIATLSLLLVLLKGALRTYIFRQEISFSVWVIPLYLLSYLLYFQGANYFRYTTRIRYMASANLCFPYLHIAFVVLYSCIFGPISVDMLVTLMALSALLVATPIWVVIVRELGANLSFYDAKGLVSDIKLGIPLVLGFVVDFILAGSDRYLLALYLSVTEVGYYVPGYALGSVIVLFPKAIGTALPQLISQAVDGGKEAEAYTMLHYAIKLFVLLAIPFVFGSLALSKPILNLLADQEIAERAFLVPPIVALGTLFYGLTLLLSNGLFVRMKTDAIFKTNLVAAIFNLLANSILLYFFRSIIVAAITTLVSYVVAFVYAYRTAIKEWSIEFESKTIAKSVAASAMMMGFILLVMTYLDIYHLGTLVACLLGAILVYALCLLGLKTFSDKEILFLKSQFRGRLVEEA